MYIIKGTILRMLRLFAPVISVGLLAVMTIGTNTVSAQTPIQIGSRVDSPELIINSSDPLVPINPGKLSFQEVAGGLTNPVFITNAGDGSGRLFIVEKTGTIRILKNGSLLGTPFLDIHTTIKSGGEQGLLALAFHPSYSTNGFFYLAYTAPREGDTTGSNLVLEKYSVSETDGDLANPGSGVILMTIPHPTYSNHNGGTLAFGGDGYLYWSTGDGGGGGDPANNAQQLNNLLGKIIRIDVNSGSPYGIPTSNPFYSSSDPNIKKEIWAYGLRNPWRLAFDSLTGDLYIGDVGQSAREEVDFQLASSTGGENYGWRVMEGSICYNPSSGCDQSGKILPVTEYNHTVGCSITGGYVYRGTDFPSLTGYYFYGDYCKGKVFSLHNDPGLGWTSVQLADTPYFISTFGEDEQGELYLADITTGKIYHLRYQEGPIVESILRANDEPTASANVDFTITFSESVTEVDPDDFDITVTGDVSGATVSEINGTGNVYTATVNTGGGDGTIRLDLVDNDTILNGAGKKLGGTVTDDGSYTTGQTYTIDKTAPTVASSDRVNPGTTNRASVQFTVTFSETVTGVDLVGPPFNDFLPTTSSGITGAFVTGVSGSGKTYTVTVNTGSGNGTLRLDVVPGGAIQDQASNLLTTGFTAGQAYTVNKTLVYNSSGANDGWVLESTEASNLGGILNSAAATIRLGDDAQDRQFRSILHFNTNNLPDSAVITKATLKIKQHGLVGTDPFSTLGSLRVDMRRPFFGTTAGLVSSDFQAASGKPAVATFNATAIDNWYYANLNGTGRTYINRTGTTQFRLRFVTDDNDNHLADYMNFISGNVITASNRPQLIIQYYVP
jgi:glucose/arabinose dehydrogenase